MCACVRACVRVCVCVCVCVCVRVSVVAPAQNFLIVVAATSKSRPISQLRYYCGLCFCEVATRKKSGGFRLDFVDASITSGGQLTEGLILVYFSNVL